MQDPNSFSNFANRSSTKWLRYDADVLPMHVAEMDFEVAKPIRDKISEMALNSDLGYLGIFPASDRLLPVSRKGDGAGKPTPRA